MKCVMKIPLPIRMNVMSCVSTNSAAAFSKFVRQSDALSLTVPIIEGVWNPITVVVCIIQRMNKVFPKFGSPLQYAEPPWYQSGVSPYYNDHHVRWRAHVRAWVDRELTPHVSTWEAAGEIPGTRCVLVVRTCVLMMFKQCASLQPSATRQGFMLRILKRNTAARHHRVWTVSCP
jgi:hypothetical protein